MDGTEYPELSEALEYLLTAVRAICDENPAGVDRVQKRGQNGVDICRKPLVRIAFAVIRHPVVGAGTKTSRS